MSATADHLEEIAGDIEARAENDPDATGDSLVDAYKRAKTFERLAEAWREISQDDRGLAITAIVRTRVKDAAPAEQYEDEQAAIDAAIVAEEDRIGRLEHDADTTEPVDDRPTDWKCSDNPNCDGNCCATPDTGGVEGPYRVGYSVGATTGKRWPVYAPNGEVVMVFVGDNGQPDAIRHAADLNAAYSEGHNAGFRARWKDIGTDEVLAEAHQKIEKAQTVRGGLPFINAVTAREIINDLAAAHKAGASGSGEAAKPVVELKRLNPSGSEADDYGRGPTAVKVNDSVYIELPTFELAASVADFARFVVQSDRYLATQNPASGSDGLKAKAVEVIDCWQDWLNAPRGDAHAQAQWDLTQALVALDAVLGRMAEKQAALSDGGTGDE